MLMHNEKPQSKFRGIVTKVNGGLAKFEATLSIAILWLLIIDCCIFIACRYIFKIATPWADELARYLLILLGWMGASCAAADNGHLDIDVITPVLKKLTRNPNKILAVLHRVAQVLSLVFMGVFIYYYTVFVVKFAKTHTPSATLPFEMWIPMSFVIVGGVLVMLHTILNILLPYKPPVEDTENAAPDSQMEGN